MRKSNLLGGRAAGDDEDEEDPLDRYMREIEEQTGVAKNKNQRSDGKVNFTKGETLGNIGLDGQLNASARGEKMAGDDEDHDAVNFYLSQRKAVPSNRRTEVYKSSKAYDAEDLKEEDYAQMTSQQKFEFVTNDNG